MVHKVYNTLKWTISLATFDLLLPAQFFPGITVWSCFYELNQWDILGVLQAVAVWKRGAEHMDKQKKHLVSVPLHEWLELELDKAIQAVVANANMKNVWNDSLKPKAFTAKRVWDK